MAYKIFAKGKWLKAKNGEKKPEMAYNINDAMPIPDLSTAKVIRDDCLEWFKHPVANFPVSIVRV